MSSILTKGKRISGNRLWKCAKKIVRESGDPGMLAFVKELSKHCMYIHEDNMFVMDLKAWASDCVEIKECFPPVINSTRVSNFFRLVMDAYSTFHYFTQYTPFRFEKNVYDEVLNYVSVSLFEPDHMQLIDDVPPSILNRTETPNPPPQMLVEIPVIIAAVDAQYPVEVDVNESTLAISYGAREGYPNAVVTAVSEIGMQKNLESMAMNTYNLDRVSNTELFSSLMMVMKDADIQSIDQITIEIPDKERLAGIITTYDTGTGLIPFDAYETMVTDPTTLETSVLKRKPRKKKAMADQLAALICKYLDDLQQSQEVRDRVFPGVSVCLSNKKYEILNAVSTATKKELVDMHGKLRIFFVEAAHHVFVSYIALKNVFDYLSRTGWELGTQLSDGGFLEIFEGHACGTATTNQEKWESVYVEYPFLRARTYLEGDISKFDQSLLRGVLLVAGMFFAMFFKTHNDNFTTTVLGDVIFRLVYKYLFLVPIQRLYFVEGMMFSGKFETSHGNTAYQNLVFFGYINKILMRNKKKPNYHLLEMIVNKGMIVRSFSGDDTMLSWPTYCEEEFGLSKEDYIAHAAQYGLRFKYFDKKSIYGVVLNVQINGSWYTKEILPGITFLKNSMSYVYDQYEGEEPQLQGLYPYRSAQDLLFRIGNSDIANSTVDGFMAKVLSIGYLCIANRHAYEKVGRVYALAKRVFRDPVLDIEVIHKILKNSGSLYNIYTQIENFDFPTLEYLRKRHDRAIKKIKRGINQGLVDPGLSKMLAGMRFDFFGEGEW